MTGWTVSRYGLFETFPETIELELRPAVCKCSSDRRIKGQFRGDGRTVRTLVFGVYKICCITGSYLWVIQKDITL